MIDSYQRNMSLMSINRNTGRCPIDTIKKNHKTAKKKILLYIWYI